ncbi:MAG: FtsQ-type POTRA domain-containing protein [Spirochaetales bacterium]
MNENYVWPDANDYAQKSVTMQEKKERSHNVFKTLKILVGALSAVLVLELFAYFFVIPYFTDCNFVFSGLNTVEKNNVDQIIGNYCGTNWLTFDTALAAGYLLSNSAIESVSVEKQFPNRIHIAVTERTPVAITLINENNHTYPVFIDKNGVAFGIAGNDFASTLPLITGFEINTFFDGMRLDSKFYPLLQQIADIHTSNPAYFSVISEICILPKEYDNYELIVYPMHSKTRVHLDRNFNEESLQYMMVALDVIKNVQPSVSEVDLRYGSISYKIGA